MLVFYMLLLLFSVSLSCGLYYAACTYLHKVYRFHVDTLDTLNVEPTQLYLFCDGFSYIQHKIDFLDISSILWVK
jgi:hypothetical protein